MLVIQIFVYRQYSYILARRQGRSIRLIGLHVTLPEEKASEQMSLW